MSEFFTPRQVSRALGVSESSLKRWCDQELLKTVRTAGGHRRVAYAEIARFCRESGRELADPQVLGMPAAVGHGTTVLGRAGTQLKEALIAGDENVARRVMLDLYLTKHPIWQIGDEVLSSALHDIGDAWQCGDIAVWQERRGCEIVQRAIYELSNLLPTPRAEAPLAIGGTLEGDPYRLSTMLCEAVLREGGWRAESFGSSIPIYSFAQAIRELRPKLCWVSISMVPDRERFAAQFVEVCKAVQETGSTLTIGGRAVDDELCANLPAKIRCATLKALHELAAERFDTADRKRAKR